MTTSRIRDVTPPPKLGAIVQFKDVRQGLSFKVLKPEIHQSHDKWGGKKEIANDGVYSKVGAGYAHDRKTGRDAIFAPKMPCRIISSMGRYWPGDDMKMLLQGQPKEDRLGQPKAA